jgi:7-cyano-7-deazaguanine synthase
MSHKAFVLLSGGMDSTTCLYKAIEDYRTVPPARGLPKGQQMIDWVEAVSMNYGQRHAKEMIYAANLCDQLGIKHSVFSLSDVLSDESTMLTNPDIPLPKATYAELPEGVSPTYVPNRNMVMLSILTAHAQKWINKENAASREQWKRTYGESILPGGAADTAHAGIYFGAHAEDAHNWAYPDCTPEFIGGMAASIYVASYHQVRLHTPLMSLNKAEVVMLGERLGVPWEKTWSCYAGGEKHCGTCPTCNARKEAFTHAGVEDPTAYES